MDSDLSVQLTMAQKGQTQSLVGIALVKKQHEMDMAMATMIDEVARAAPPPGQGKVVDKVA